MVKEKDAVEEIEVKVDEAEVEIELADDDAPEAEVKAEESKAEPEDKLDDSIIELKAQLERERLARAEAEKRAREAAEHASRASGDVYDTNIQLLKTAIDTVKGENAALKARMRDALAIGDHDSVADINEAMANNAAKIMQLEAGKAQLEAKPRPVYEIPPIQDPVEAFASQLSPRSADFIRKNPQTVTDPRLNRIMISAHELALSKGLQADTDDYFNFISESLELPRNVQKVTPRQEEDSALSSASAPVQRRSAPPAAPVSRSPTNNSGNRPNVVRLTAEEREMAQMMGMTPKEYAENKEYLRKTGKLTH